MAAGALFIGLMSGTSLDAVDAVLVEFKSPDTRAPDLLATHRVSLDDLRTALLALMQPGADELARSAQADVALGERFAEACLGLLAKAGVAADAVQAIGSHGQTIRHCPHEHYTLQIGDPNVICQRTGITVVADLRRRDVAAGGQGAPLVPAFHAAAWRHPEHARCVINVGGMANVTVLPSAAERAVLGFDTGPGNVLMDAWAQHQWGLSHDHDGARAAAGKVQPLLLEQLLCNPYFSAPPPKSTGRETFNFGWLQSQLAAHECAPEDVQATLTELTAASVAHAICTHAAACEEVLICGGGALNPVLMARLAHHLAPRPVTSTQAVGLHPQWVEPVAFAWLARETLAGRAGNVPSATGAAAAVVLGGIYRP